MLRATGQESHPEPVKGQTHYYAIAYGQIVSSGGFLNITQDEDRWWKSVLAYNPRFRLLAEADSTKTNITDS